MNLYCIKCLIFTKNVIIKIKRKIDRKINLYSRCIYYFKKFEIIHEEEQIYLLWGLI